MLKKLLIPFVLLIAGSASAQADGPPMFSIDWYTIDVGGGHSAAGEFSLTGTIGQPDAVYGGASGGIYGFVGGFWGGPIEFLFIDGFEGP